MDGWGRYTIIGDLFLSLNCILQKGLSNRPGNVVVPTMADLGSHAGLSRLRPEAPGSCVVSYSQSTHLPYEGIPSFNTGGPFLSESNQVLPHDQPATRTYEHQPQEALKTSLFSTLQSSYSRAT